MNKGVTYDALEKVSKAELIAWLKRNIFLPPISDEQFLQEAKLQKLMDANEKLLEESKALNKKLREVSNNHFEFMKIMVELDKLNDKINKNSTKIERFSVCK